MEAAQIKLKSHAGVDGAFTFKVYKASTGEVVRELTVPSENIITDIGLNRIATSPVCTHCYVGTGTGTPAATDTNMFSQLATTVSPNVVAGTPSGPPLYYTVAFYIFRFPIGTAAGNLTEVGVGWNSNPNLNIFSHALIVDGSGNPTTLTVLPDEVLDVTYIFRLYPEVTDVNTPSVLISGTPYACVTRPSLVNSWGPSSLNAADGLFGVGNGPTVSNGALGTITGQPSGTSAGISISAVAYSSGSHKRGYTASASLTQGNVPGGISAIHYSTAGGNGVRFQTSYSPSIPKDSTNILTLGFEISWGRYTI